MGFAARAGEQAVMADAVKALGQDVHKEAPDELVGVERHGAMAVSTTAAVILVSERHARPVERYQTMVRDRDAVGVARQVGKYGLGA